MESEATTPDVCVVKVEPESEPTVQQPQPVVAVEDQPVEDSTPSSTLHALKAVVREKTGILEKLSALEKEEATLKQRQKEITREKGEMHERLRELTNRELSSLLRASTDSPGNNDGGSLGTNRPEIVRKRRTTDTRSETPGPTPKSAKRETAKVSMTFKQLQDFIDDLKQEGQFVGEHQCPVCPAKRPSRSSFVLHLYFHLGTKDHHFYRCPFEDCVFRTITVGNVKAHIASGAHKAVWNEDMHERCVIQNNFDAFNALCRP